MVWLYSGVQMMLQLYGNGVQMGPVGAGATVNEVPSEKKKKTEEERRRRKGEKARASLGAAAAKSMPGLARD